MAALDHLGTQFDNVQRVAQFRAAKSVPGTKAPVFFANPKDRYVQNPLAAHLPPSVVEHGEDDHGPYTRTIPQHGIPGYSRTAMVERPKRVEQVPLNRLESTQSHVSRTHVSNMSRRKGSPPPIDVVHHVEQDRYVVEEGNHRAIVAMMKGQTHIPALVTRIRQT